jgi:LemA protein
MKQHRQAQGSLNSALPRLLVNVESYPDLKSNQNFMNLQTPLESTRNRINVERNRFNSSVSTYDKYIKVFPNSIFAEWFSFEDMSRYSADEGSENAKKVEFDFE